ncbi:hypothetical protein BC831DRAFT_443295 [Entophlyctis helioformis]|nr:hypothetical protein BC831DRAFT_443295 [Entophlyctis helioformis]
MLAQPPTMSELPTPLLRPARDAASDAASHAAGAVPLPAPSVRDEARAIVPDGGIMKIPIRPPPAASDRPIPWSRGANARIHYTVHAYVRGDEDEQLRRLEAEQKAKERAEQEALEAREAQEALARSKDACCDSDSDCDSDCSHSHHDHSHAGRTAKLNAKAEMFRKILDTAKASKTAAATKTPPSAAETEQRHRDAERQKQQQQDAVMAAYEGKAPIRQKISDSRENDPNEPFELRIGYDFSVKAMEICVKSMRVGERARFLCMPEYCEGFIQLETVLRQEKLNRENLEKGLPPVRVGGCCAHASASEMDANRDLMAIYGVPLEFDIELVQVQLPNSFLKQAWEMEPYEKYREVPVRKDEGAALYKKGDYAGALAKYERALVLLESLAGSGVVLELKREKMEKERIAREQRRKAGSAQPAHPAETLEAAAKPTTPLPPSPNDEIQLDVVESLTQACRLNYAACKLKLGDLPAVVTQTTEVLKHDPRNIKALFRRSQAYTRIGRDLDMASADLDALKSILETSDPSAVRPNGPEWTEYFRERAALDVKIKAHADKEKRMYGGMFG